MTNISMSTLLASAAAAVLAAGTPAASEAAEYRVVVSETFKGDAEALTGALQRFFVNRVRPGDTFSLWDGTENKRIVKITVPDDKRYEVVKRKVRKFAREIARIGRFVKDRASGEADASARLDTLSVLRGVGDNRVDAGEDIHVLMIGSPLQVTLDTDWSMIGDDGEHRVPTDAALLTTPASTPYSSQRARGRPEGQLHPYVHGRRARPRSAPGHGCASCLEPMDEPAGRGPGDVGG